MSRIGRDQLRVRTMPIAELVGRAFRAGSSIPLIVLVLLIAIAVPIGQVALQTDKAENFAAVLEGIVNDRVSIFADKGERVAVLLGTEGDDVSSSERLDQLLALDRSIESALMTNQAGAIVSVVSKSIDTADQQVDAVALAHITDERTPYVGVPRFDASVGKHSFVLAVPITTPSGEPRGILQMTIGTTWMTEAISRTNESLGTNTYLVDAAGNLIAHAEAWRVLAGQSRDSLESGLVTGLDGARRIAGTVEASGWGGELFVVNVFPLSSLIPGVAAGLVPIIIIGLAFSAGRRAKRKLVKSVVAPVHALGENLRSYGPDNLELRIPPSEVEEINIAAEAFNSTAARVDSLVESLTASESRFRAMFDNAPVGIALHSIDGRYLATNGRYDEMFGSPADGFTLEDLLKMILPESRETLLKAFDEIVSRRSDTITIDGGFVSASGKTVWAVLTTTYLPQPAGKPDQILAQVTDVTELKDTQQRLEELLATKNQFLAAVSHELRTPLTAVIGLAELLRDPDNDLDPEQRSSLINTIVESGFDVSNMVEDLLTAARQEAGQLTVVKVPVNLLAQARQALEAFDPDSKIPVNGESPAATADPGRVRQILRNLLTNAVKYGGDDVRVDLDQIDGFARAVVSDDGPGVPEGLEEKIFKSYERAHSKETHPGSVGIGLSISRELARQMGGDLVYRHLDGRTRFELTVPLSA